MEHAASIGAGASAAHAAAAGPSSARTAPAEAPASAAGTATAVSISAEGHARAAGEVGDAPHPVLLAAHLALAALGEPEGLIGDAVQLAAGYAARAGIDLAGRIDEIV